MKCPACNAEVHSGSVFCSKCGASLSASAQPPVGQAADEPLSGRRLQPAPLSVPGTGDDDEQSLWDGRFSMLAMIGEWIGGGVITVAMIIVAVTFSFSSAGWWWTVAALVVMWLALAARLLYRQLSLRYYLTNQRFVHESGLLWRNIDRIEVIDVDDVTVQQGPVERMLGIGTIRLRSSDTTTPEFFVQGIEDVRRVAGLLDDARRKERRKRGLYVEQI
jgi:membrane protein YdbS with pleckstrin-like domain